MNAIVECLDQLSPQPLETILYVGVRAREVIERCRTLKRQQLIVACPDPELASELRQQAAGLPWVRVVEELPTPGGTPARWQRLNVRGLGSLLAPRRLSELYPRLAPIDTVPVAGASLATLLERLGLGPARRGANLLAIDLPGVEASLFHGLAPTALDGLRWIALAGVDPTLYDGAAPLSKAVDTLAASHFRRAWSNQATQALWPAALLEFDETALAAQQRGARVEALTHELATLKQQHAASQRQAADAQAQLSAAAQAREQQERSAAQQQARLDEALREKDDAAKLAESRRAEFEAAKKARDEQMGIAAALKLQVDALTPARAQAEKLAAENKAQVEKLAAENKAQADKLAEAAKARDEQGKLAAERQARLDALARERAEVDKKSVALGSEAEAARKEIDGLKSARDAAMKTRDEQMRLVGERQARIDELTRAKGEADKLADSRRLEIEALKKARDDQARLVETRLAEIEALMKARDEQSRAAAERQARVDELTRAKAEADKLAESLKKARDDQAALATERQAQVTSLTQAKTQADKLAADRKEQVDALTRDKATLSKARDDQAKLAAERERRVNQVEAELADVSGRQTLLREELVKAEAQVELITDLIWREGR